VNSAAPMLNVSFARSIGAVPASAIALQRSSTSSSW
jgi:hypothetical protein